ncbi:MAG: hypothetical protein ACLP07_14880 [Terracidiphilus sp.]
MLAIYDQAGPRGSRRLIPDALASLARQWFVRENSWMWVLAIFVAVWQAAFLVPMIHVAAYDFHRTLPVDARSGRLLMLLVIFSATGIVILVGIASLHVQSHLRHRSRALCRPARGQLFSRVARWRSPLARFPNLEVR